MLTSSSPCLIVLRKRCSSSVGASMLCRCMRRSKQGWKKGALDVKRRNARMEEKEVEGWRRDGIWYRTWKDGGAAAACGGGAVVEAVSCPVIISPQPIFSFVCPPAQPRHSILPQNSVRKWSRKFCDKAEGGALRPPTHRAWTARKG